MTTNTKLIALSSALFFPLAVGCSSVHDSYSSTPSDVPEGLLQYADDSDLGEVHEARAAHDDAVDRLAAARHNERETAQQSNVLEEQVELAEQRVEVERARVEARAKSDTAAVEEAEAQKHEAELRVDAARRELELNARRVQVRKADVTVAEADVRLAESRVELAKARAVAPLDRPEADAVDVEDFEAEVRERETKLAIAKVERDAAQREFEIFEKNGPEIE